MTGFVAIWNVDGEPVDEALLVRMQNFLAARGPDEQRHVISGARGNVGLVHAAFHTTFEAHRQHQPCAIADAWLTGGFRVDARERLCNELGIEDIGREPPTDAQLILQAYRRWGADFVDHLLGDFSFAIWDEREERLIGARDQLGVRPFFYAHAGHCWILSNSIDCIRLHPKVSDDLDDDWIASFLSDTRTKYSDRTVYREIKRLPPGHVLEVTRAAQRVRKYWQLEIGDPIFYKREEEYFERFKEVARLAIGDRIRTKKIGVEMSGGLDSTSIVAFISQMIKEGRDVDLVVKNNYFATLIPDDEQHFASAAARHIGVPIHHKNSDDVIYDPEWWTRSPVQAEPHYVVLKQTPWLNALQQGPYKDVRVIFYGFGVDECLVYGDLRPYLRWLFETGRFAKFGSAVFSTLRERGLSIAVSKARAALGLRARSLTFETPAWLRPDADDDYQSSCQPHPWRPMAVQAFSSPSTADAFSEPGIGGWNVESVYPFMDLRMVQFLLSVPVVPWSYRKLLLRKGMRGLLPDAVLQREKAPLSEDPFMKEMSKHPFPPIEKSSELGKYVDLSKVPTDWPTDAWEFRLTHRLLVFQYWLSRRRRSPL